MCGAQNVVCGGKQSWFWILALSDLGNIIKTLYTSLFPSLQ